MTYKNAYDIADAFGYLTHDEVTGLKNLVKMLPENPVVVAIGVGSGTGSVAMLEERKDLKLISVDIREESPFGGLQNELNAIELTEGLNVDGRHEQILGDSKEVGTMFKSEIDMVFIDGDHSYTGCLGDFENWIPHVKFGGVVAFDDYGDNKDGIETWPDVRKVVDKYVRPKFNEIGNWDSVIAFAVI